MILNITPPSFFFTKNIKAQWFKIIIVLLGLILLWVYRQPMIGLLQVISDREAINAFLGKFGPFGSPLLAIILVLQVIVAAIPGHALMIGGSYVYGFSSAFWINLLATVGGSQVAFLLARSAGRPLIERLAPADLLNKWNRISAKKGLFFFMLSFLLPLFPADVMNYVAGFSSLSSRRFFIANLFGRLPGVALMTAVGAYGFQLSLQIWLIILIIAAATLILFRHFAFGRLLVNFRFQKSGLTNSEAAQPDISYFRGES